MTLHEGDQDVSRVENTNTLDIQSYPVITAWGQWVFCWYVLGAPRHAETQLLTLGVWMWSGPSLELLVTAKGFGKSAGAKRPNRKW